MAECIRHTELPHTSRLFADLVCHFDCVQGFYHHAPFSENSFFAAAESVKIDSSHRARLVEVLRAENSQSGEAARAHLERLERPETLVVAAGQQVGLYTGPIFTIYKALSAARLASELTEKGLPAVPVFWLATEDHDLAEIDHVWVFDAQNRPIRLQASASPADGAGRPVGPLAVGDASRASLQRALADLPFGSEITRLAQEAYPDGVTFGGGFKSLLRRLLAPHGVLLLDPLSPGVRRLAAPLLRQVIEQGPELNVALRARGRQLEQSGYHAQVHVEESTSLFFLIENGRRISLRRSGQSGREYTANGRTHQQARLLARLEDEAEAFSPNALLRPVVQDFLLPTVAYLGGPAELAYLAQSEVLYRRLLGRMPVALPRAGFTILDARSQKLMSRYGLRLTDALSGAEALEQRIAEVALPERVRAATRSSQEQIETALRSLEEELLAFDPTLAAAVNLSGRKIRYQLSKIQAKGARENLRRVERCRADAAYLSGLILPEKTLQERFYSVLPFLARHGLGLLDRLYGSIRFDCPDHQVLVA